MKIHPLVLIYSSIPLILKSLQKFTIEKKRAIIIVPSWKRQVWSEMIKKFTKLKVILEKFKKRKKIYQTF